MLGLPGDAVCEDCCCDPSLGGVNVDVDCDCGGALSLGRAALGMPEEGSGEPFDTADDSLETGQTVV